MHVGDIITNIFFLHARNRSILAEIFGSHYVQIQELGLNQNGSL